MLTLNIENLLEVSHRAPENSLNQTEIDSNTDSFQKYFDSFVSQGQGWTDLVYDTENLSNIQKFITSVVGKYKSVVIIGIGGSMLGPKCILDALNTSTEPKVYCVDNVDPFEIHKIHSELDYSQTLFLVQSKSGGTPETAAQYLYFRNHLNSLGLNSKDHFVIVTDPDAGVMREIVTNENLISFPLPSNVGGRYSVLSSVGLVISGLIGLDIIQLLAGAQQVFENDIHTAFSLATIQYQLLKKGKNINVIMPYSSRLKSFSEWCIQLISESLGKKFDLNGHQINTGITPLVSVGATDQHSQLQLFAEGQKDKLVVFLEIKNHGVDAMITDTAPKVWEYLSGVSFGELINAECYGTGKSLVEESVPNITLEIDTLNEFSLGQLFMMFELATAFVGEMLNINTFDQPGVERSKVLTKQKLAQ
jgi:glucose-6-phosphate isomerase